MKVAALAGAAKHALSHVKNGVDIIVAQGYEAGGHTGEIASMVLVPEVVDAVGESVPVLAAGGIGSGRQIAAALALGARGVWMGSVWLGTAEYQTPPAWRGNHGPWRHALVLGVLYDFAMFANFFGVLPMAWIGATIERTRRASIVAALTTLMFLLNCVHLPLFD